MRTGAAEPELRLTDAGQVEALRSAVFHSARAQGLGPTRAAAVAEQVAVHLVGQLAQQGYALRVEWVSVKARDALVAARRGWGIPDRTASDVE